MRELAVVISNNNEGVTAYETIDAIKKAGFKNVFIQWYDKDWNPSQEEQLAYARKQGLNVIFAHLGYPNINEIWVDSEEGEQLVEKYQKDIQACKDNDIPMVVMHLTSKEKAPAYNELGLRRIQEIVDYAKEIGVKVAFENTKIKGYLDYVIGHIKNDNVGICYDSGHCHAHFQDEFNFPFFQDRIFAVHLHDNKEGWDQHLFPFDGSIDWETVIRNLKEEHYEGPITMELIYQNDYLNMNIEEFFQKGYEVGEKLQKLFEEV